MRFYSEEDWHRLVRYLAGEWSSDQKAKMEAWILEDEQRAHLMDDLNEIWEAGNIQRPSRNVDAAWEEMCSELDFVPQPPTQTSPNPTRSMRDESKEYTSMEDRDDGTCAQGRRSGDPGSSITPIGENVWKLLSPKDGEPRNVESGIDLPGFIRGSVTGYSGVAGIFLVLGILGVLLLGEVSFENTDTSSSKTFSTEAGERSTVRLNDGSKVHLNVESRLELEAGFGEDARIVHLDGEAFFEVADDRANPFIVQTDGVRTEVVGTSFNVESYSDAYNHEVAVVEGRVTVHSDQSTTADSLELRANNLGIVSVGHIEVLRTKADVGEEIAWKDGRLVFDDAPFDQVIRDLQRWYDAEVYAEVNSGEVENLNATFEEGSLQEAVRAISVALDLQYRKENGSLIFYRTAE